MASPINDASLEQRAARDCQAHHLCSFVSRHLLEDIVNIGQVSETTRIAAQKTLVHLDNVHQRRAATHRHLLTASAQNQGRGGQSFIPPQIFQAMRASEATSYKEKEIASHGLETIIALHDARMGANSWPESVNGARDLFRLVYDSKKSDAVDVNLLYEEGGNLPSDKSANNVCTFFKNTFDFYYEVFDRNSIDDHGLKLKANVHYDDVPGPPGLDNAFWDPSTLEMSFGDGDGSVFGDFTTIIDIIGHELTHGVTQFSANLPPSYQAGALNESISDVFGSMIKQYANGKQLAKDANWLIGEGIFLPTITNAKALRSLKAPGTAYDNPKIGKDDQSPTMDGYQHLPNTASGDYGGVHANNGIPNHAFYLIATALGGHSWDQAGKIWYAALQDPALQAVNEKTAFKEFADITVKQALTLFGKDVQATVKKAWADVKVLKAG